MDTGDILQFELPFPTSIFIYLLRLFYELAIVDECRLWCVPRFRYPLSASKSPLPLKKLMRGPILYNNPLIQY